jgi:FtsP/CotA-like multicopper oxidase with cupredoxin domain
VSSGRLPHSLILSSSAKATPTVIPSSATCQLPTTPITNDQQVGNSTLGTLCNPTIPKWLNKPNGEPYPDAPWGDLTVKNSDATIKDSVPTTNVTRTYDWTISRSTLSPDGVLRDVILVNNQFPGPVLEANWGDWIEVTVRNNISNPYEGTSVHWHGMLQRGSQWEDGTPGVSQCPIAPGHEYRYRFRAEIYGSSFYHAHYSAQYTAGVYGPMVVHGPASAEYDVDVGAVMLSDWVSNNTIATLLTETLTEILKNHIPYFSMVENVVGTDLSKIPPVPDNGLINGRGQFDCSKPSYSNSSEWLGTNLRSNITWTCVEGAQRAQFRFEKGKTHRLRLMNVGADGE